MRLLIASDLHLEFHRDQGRSFVEHLAPLETVDVCILAGDIAVADGIPRAMQLFCERYRHVLYIHGNHEFYGSDRTRVLEWTRQAADAHPNLFWLQQDVAEIDGRRFLGAPLWFEHRPENDRPKRFMNDFALIDGFETWVYEENLATRRFLTDQVHEGDIVVTHHLPSLRSVHPVYEGHPLNAFFVCDVGNIIEDTRPVLWVHGHSHHSVDYRLASTRVLSNPFGYAGREQNASFDFHKVVDI